MIGVVNYGAGNVGSVMNALRRLGLTARFASGPEELSLVPGVSPFEKIIPGGRPFCFCHGIPGTIRVCPGSAGMDCRG